MLKLFRYLKKAYVPVIAIVLLLILQASCDLTLPTFTSNIVNVGIQQKGIEDAVPDVMREETFLALKSLMKQDDAVTDYECMSDLTACSVGTCYDLAVNDDSAADTSSESDHDHILRTCRCTFPCFTECCYVCIVSCLSLKSCEVT